MIDFLSIQDVLTGSEIFRFRGKSTLLDGTHEDIFHAFLNANQSIIHELKLGELTQISTKEHHCLFHTKKISPEFEIMAVILIDNEDCVDHWKNKAELISEKFAQRYGSTPFSGNVSLYSGFKSSLMEIIEIDSAEANACSWDV